MSAAFAASTSDARASDSGLPESSSSPCHHDRDVHAVERFRFLQRSRAPPARRPCRPSCRTFPGRARVCASTRSNRWNGWFGSNTVSRCPISSTCRPAARMLGDQVTGASERCAVLPAHLEAERLEPRPQHVRDLAHAGEIHGAAVDVDDLFEQRDRACLAAPGPLTTSACLGRGRRADCSAGKAARAPAAANEQECGRTDRMAEFHLWRVTPHDTRPMTASRHLACHARSRRHGGGRGVRVRAQASAVCERHGARAGHERRRSRRACAGRAFRCRWI